MKRHRFLAICLSATFSLATLQPVHAEKPTKVEIVKLGKQATALVEVKNRGTGSAFCIHASGLFITNDHVIGNAETPEIKR
jgi:S1-C subfamily serine protease